MQIEAANWVNTRCFRSALSGWARPKRVSLGGDDRLCNHAAKLIGLVERARGQELGFDNEADPSAGLAQLLKRNIKYVNAANYFAAFFFGWRGRMTPCFGLLGAPK